MDDTNKSIISAVLQPLDKLFETVACGVGKVYEPFHIKRMAKAKAQEIELISEAICNHANLPIEYTDGAISINTQDAKDLVFRAQNRLLFQEMKKQQNIEAVVANAYTSLENVTSVSETPVDIDWINEFFNAVANISSEQMQQLWGKLLAGEIKQPGSFSLRTLETLKKLSSKEAHIFEEIAPFVLKCKGDRDGSYFDFFLMKDTDGRLLSRYGISFKKIMRLCEAGILSANNQISIGLYIDASEFAFIEGRQKVIQIRNLGDYSIRISHLVHILTESGKELLPIVLKNIDSNIDKSNAYLSDCLNELKAGSLTAINSRFSMQYNYNISWEIISSK